MNESRRQALIERLQISLLRSDVDSDFAGGYFAGKEWAEKEAEAESLKLIEQAFAGADFDAFVKGCRRRPRPDTTPTYVASIFLEINDRDDGKANEFWKARAASLAKYPDTVKVDAFQFYWGFIRGALDVWLAVKDDLIAYQHDRMIPV